MKKTSTGQETYQAIYQRKKYAPIKKEVAKKKKEDFFARYPNWEQKKISLTEEEIYIVSSYYGLDKPRLSNREVAKQLNITTQWLYVRRKKIEARLEQN